MCTRKVEIKMGRKSKKEVEELREVIFEHLKEFILENGYPPSVREIADAVGLDSPSSAQAQLNKLIEMGRISRDLNSPRSIIIHDDAFNLSRRTIINVPILKNYSNIEMMFDEENVEDYLPFPTDVIGSDDHFMIVLVGSHMKNIAMLDGDKLLVKKQETADSEDIVVAYVKDNVVVRRLIKENNGYKLIAESESRELIFAERIKIIGKVVGVIRKI